MSRHWFLTGASSGIGRHLAEIILASGDDLTATVRRPETLDDLAARYGDQLVVERLDVTVKGDIAPVVQRAEARRPVDVLVNNAGGGIIGATEEFSDADIEGQISLNLLAPVHVTRAFIPAMRTRRAGRIIQISSASGQGSLPTSSLYHAAKWGLEGFSECLRQELEGFGVFVTLIEPAAHARASAAICSTRRRTPPIRTRLLDRFARCSRTRVTSCTRSIRRRSRTGYSTRPRARSHRFGWRWAVTPSASSRRRSRAGCLLLKRRRVWRDRWPSIADRCFRSSPGRRQSQQQPWPRTTAALSMRAPYRPATSTGQVW